MAETIDWVSALSALGATELVRDDVVRTLSTLAKTPDDRAAITEALGPARAQEKHMKIDNEFTVSVPIERAWKVLTDLGGHRPVHARRPPHGRGG